MFCITFLCFFSSVSLSKLWEGDKDRQGRESKREKEEEMGERDKGRDPYSFGVLVEQYF